MLRQSRSPNPFPCEMFLLATTVWLLFWPLSSLAQDYQIPPQWSVSPLNSHYGTWLIHRGITSLRGPHRLSLEFKGSSGQKPCLTICFRYTIRTLDKYRVCKSSRYILMYCLRCSQRRSCVCSKCPSSFCYRYPRLDLIDVKIPRCSEGILF